MSTRTIYVAVAGIGFEFSTDGSLSFSPDDNFRGFACGCATAHPYKVIMRRSFARAEDVDAAERASSFVGDNSNGEFAQYRWEVYSTPACPENVMVSFLSAGSVVWVKGALGERDIVIDVALPEDASGQVSAYMFPFFNLMLSLLLRRRGNFLIHSSVVADGNNGYLFTAVSGTGKSTMAGLWQRCGATIINDDMLAIVAQPDGRHVACNIPMPNYQSEPRSVALSGIFLISQSPANVLGEVRGAAASLRVMANTIHMPTSPGAAQSHLSAVARMCQSVPVFSLGFKPDTEVVDLIRNLNIARQC